MVAIKWTEMGRLEDRPCLSGLRKLWELPSRISRSSLEFVIVPKPSKYTHTVVISRFACAILNQRGFHKVSFSTSPHRIIYFFSLDMLLQHMQGLALYAPLYVELHYTAL